MLLIAPLAALAAGAGLFTGGGPGAREHLSVRGHPVAIYDRGLYQHMSAEVAPQGIAQDVVTLFIVFLAILMTALSAKVIAMALLGYEVVPAIVLIPLSNVAAIHFARRTFREIRGGPSPAAYASPSRLRLRLRADGLRHAAWRDEPAIGHGL